MYENTTEGARAYFTDQRRRARFWDRLLPWRTPLDPETEQALINICTRKAMARERHVQPCGCVIICDGWGHDVHVESCGCDRFEP